MVRGFFFFFFQLPNSPLCNCTTACLSTHLLIGFQILHAHLEGFWPLACLQLLQVLPLLLGLIQVQCFSVGCSLPSILMTLGKGRSGCCPHIWQGSFRKQTAVTCALGPFGRIFATWPWASCASSQVPPPENSFLHTSQGVLPVILIDSHQEAPLLSKNLATCWEVASCSLGPWQLLRACSWPSRLHFQRHFSGLLAAATF